MQQSWVRVVFVFLEGQSFSSTPCISQTSPHELTTLRTPCCNYLLSRQLSSYSFSPSHYYRQHHSRYSACTAGSFPRKCRVMYFHSPITKKLNILIRFPNSTRVIQENTMKIQPLGLQRELSVLPHFHAPWKYFQGEL